MSPTACLPRCSPAAVWQLLAPFQLSEFSVPKCPVGAAVHVCVCVCVCARPSSRLCCCCCRPTLPLSLFHPIPQLASSSSVVSGHTGRDRRSGMHSVGHQRREGNGRRAGTRGQGMTWDAAAVRALGWHGFFPVVCSSRLRTGQRCRCGEPLPYLSIKW